MRILRVIFVVLVTVVFLSQNAAWAEEEGEQIYIVTPRMANPVEPMLPKLAEIGYHNMPFRWIKLEFEPFTVPQVQETMEGDVQTYIVRHVPKIKPPKIITFPPEPACEGENCWGRIAITPYR